MSEDRTRNCLYKCGVRVVDADNGTRYPNEVNTGRIHNTLRCSEALRARGMPIPAFFKDMILKDEIYTKSDKYQKDFPFYIVFRMNRYGKLQLYTKNRHIDVGFLDEKQNIIKLEGNVVTNFLKLAQAEWSTKNANESLNFVNSLDQYFGEPIKQK